MPRDEAIPGCFRRRIRPRWNGCADCAGAADLRSQRTVSQASQVLVGETDAYEARCRLHWDPDNFDPVQTQLNLGPNLAERL